MPDLSSADSYRTWADLRDVLFEIVSLNPNISAEIFSTFKDTKIILATRFGSSNLSTPNDLYFARCKSDLTFILGRWFK